MTPTQQTSRPRLIPIPPIFRNGETGALLAHCLMCGQDVLDDTKGYVIERAVRHYRAIGRRETIFEYALCIPCLQWIYKSYSNASRAELDAFLDDAKLQERGRRLLATAGDDVLPWLDHCVVHGTPIDDEDEYELIAACWGKELVLDTAPYAIGGRAMDELLQRFSNQTIGEIERWTEEYLGPPPAWKEVWRSRPTVLV